MIMKKAEQNFSLVQKENNKSEFVFEANQRTQQLKRFSKIQERLIANQPTVHQVIKDLNTPEEEQVAEIDTVDKSQEEIKQDLEAAEKETKIGNIDTLTVFGEYYKSKYELAELYYFDFNFKDSGKVILNNIVNSSYFNPYIEQSLYALYYINKLENDDEEATNYLNELKSKNAESPFVSFIETGKVVIKEKYEKEKTIFQEAESNIIENPDKSIELFKMLLNDYPENPYQGKAATYIAWIMENDKYNLDSSLTWYKTVLDSFPDSESFQLAKQKYNLLIALTDVPDTTNTSDSSATVVDSTKGISESVDTEESQPVKKILGGDAVKDDDTKVKPPIHKEDDNKNKRLKENEKSTSSNRNIE